jgi:hypothetical protein
MEKEMEEEMLMQRREEEGRGKERRKALLEREERKWKEIESSILSSMPNVGSRDAVAMAAAVRAVGGDSALGDSFARERVSGIARRIRSSQLARRAEQVLLYWSDFMFVCCPRTAFSHNNIDAKQHFTCPSLSKKEKIIVNIWSAVLWTGWDRRNGLCVR